jgi:enoyl-CoA hydratase/carnithine racemase
MPTTPTLAEDAKDILPVDHHGPVRVLTMTYPERRNAFSARMRVALAETFQRLMYEDADCRAIVLTGAAGTFCAGGDLSELKARPPIPARQVFEPAREIVRAMVYGPKPIVAAVEGTAFGAGLSLACAADYVVAARDARFCAVFLKVGLMPDTGVLWTLPRRVGGGKAREMMMLAEEVTAEDGLASGLVDQVAAPGKALDDALVVARRLADRPADALGSVKAALGEGADTPDAALRSEMDLGALLRLAAPERG